ncbi:DNA polymerase III subunit delta [Pseudoxanthomonas broegbernensis]|uniref:DNA polymerase III subunit delta n=1 Tax=Pseudoxanthomonas broegbernensis TaxID=83619 RepID=A0A7V8GL31_9GAMM|nr:DNA polymerase III subunit delta [Pseudoxanthomonas broegbernensis]KAF1685514.1 DNA polymerase III subunit delta [Pseudoxanthomonas broegbernensis]MBB6064441.1 DNA polymerase-3 subunit delta [Pseudoxanthomonas broegbernensis]
MELRPEQLVAQAGKQPLQPAYLVAGPETLHVLEAADAVRARARADGAEREVFELDGRDIDWDALSASFAAPGLFASRRLLEVRLPSGKPGKVGAEVIAGFCADPPPDTHLMIVADEWSKAHHSGKWVDAVSRRGVVSIAWALKPHELPGWIDRRLRERGLRAAPDAVQGLAERVEGNLLAAAQEIDKLALLAPEGVLDLATMESLVADAARYDVFRLLESSLSGHAAQVRRMLAGLRAEGEQVAGLMPMVIRELLRTAALARAQARGANLAAEMKSQGLWEARQAPFKRALQRHAAPLRWNRFAAYASRIDRAAKGRGPGDAWQLLERLLLAIAEPPATRLLVGTGR